MVGGDQRSRLLEHRTAVVELAAKHPDLTLQEIRGTLAPGHGISVGLTTASASAHTSSRCWRQACGTDDIVLLDNLRSHKIAGVEDAITAQAPSSFTCRPTALTSTRSSRCSQIQSGAAQGRRAHPRVPMADHRPNPRPLPAAGMPTLLYPSRLCNPIGSRS
jgi:hypothetical protein